MIRIAMAASGGFAAHLIRTVLKLPELYTLTAVAAYPDIRTEGAALCRDKGVPIYPSVDELIVNITGKCDVVYVPTPIHTHVPIAATCLEAGFDVFVEKPPAAVIQEYDRLIGMAAKQGGNVAVGFQYLYSRIVRELKANICTGKYGPVRRVRSLGCWERRDNYFVRNDWAGRLKVGDAWVLDGTINNPMAHTVANSLYLASMERGRMAEPVSVRAELYHAHDIESEDTASLRILTAGETEILFQGTLCAERIIEPVTVVECGNAVIAFSDYSRADIVYTDGRRESIVDESDKFESMFAAMAEQFKAGNPYSGSLEICRPFTLAVNGAFESSGLTHGIDNRFVRKTPVEGSVRTTVDGLDNALQKAHENGCLLSETGDLPWTVKTAPFSLEGYMYFPHKTKRKE